jgi:hypothetical protein
MRQGYVAGGLKSGDGIIVIATREHREALKNRLLQAGHSLKNYEAKDQYIALDAESVLSQFMVKEWPDNDLFKKVVLDLMARARGNGRKVRAFGEMVALLWARGQTGATVHLEHLWHSLCHKEHFSLFCAYPKSGFTQNAEASIKEICDTHSRMVNSDSKSVVL